jgi:hypothetical protein
LIPPNSPISQPRNGKEAVDEDWPSGRSTPDHSSDESPEPSSRTTVHKGKDVGCQFPEQSNACRPSTSTKPGPSSQAAPSKPAARHRPHRFSDLNNLPNVQTEPIAPTYPYLVSLPIPTGKFDQAFDTKDSATQSEAIIPQVSDGLPCSFKWPGRIGVNGTKNEIPSTASPTDGWTSIPLGYGRPARADTCTAASELPPSAPGNSRIHEPGASSAATPALNAYTMSLKYARPPFGESSRATDPESQIPSATPSGSSTLFKQSRRSPCSKRATIFPNAALDGAATNSVPGPSNHSRPTHCQTPAAKPELEIPHYAPSAIGAYPLPIRSARPPPSSTSAAEPEVPVTNNVPAYLTDWSKVKKNLRSGQVEWDGIERPGAYTFY